LLSAAEKKRAEFGRRRRIGERRAKGGDLVIFSDTKEEKGQLRGSQPPSYPKKGGKTSAGPGGNGPTREKGRKKKKGRHHGGAF